MARAPRSPASPPDPDEPGLEGPDPHEPGLEGPGSDEPGLESRLKRLETILTALEADELDLERALHLFEEGVGHVRAAERILAETELRVEELLSEDGPTRALPEFDG